MSLWNFQSFIIKKETVAWTAVKPTKALKIEWASINTKVNKQDIKQIEGKTFSPTTIVDGTVEVWGNVDFYLDRENALYFLAMMTETPTPVSNGDGTYEHSFNVETSYGLPSFTVETSKDFYTERNTWIVWSSFDLSVDGWVIKWSAELIGLKWLTTYKVTNIATDTLTVNGDVSLFLAWDKVSKNGGNTSFWTIVSTNVANSTITLWTGEGANFTVWNILSLLNQTPSYSTWIIPFRFFEKTNIKIADSIDNLATANNTCVTEFWITIANANEGFFCQWSNFASMIRQGERTMEGKITIPSELAFTEFNAYQSNEPRAFQLELSWEKIGTWTRKEKILIQGMIQYVEWPSDIKVSEFIEIPFSFRFLSDITVSVTSTIASI